MCVRDKKEGMYLCPSHADIIPSHADVVPSHAEVVPRVCKREKKEEMPCLKWAGVKHERGVADA